MIQLRMIELTSSLRLAAEVPEFLVPDLREHRVHHEQQAKCDREGNGADSKPVKRLFEAGNQGTQRQSTDHCQSDPERAGTGRGSRDEGRPDSILESIDDHRIY